MKIRSWMVAASVACLLGCGDETGSAGGTSTAVVTPPEDAPARRAAARDEPSAATGTAAATETPAPPDPTAGYATASPAVSKRPAATTAPAVATPSGSAGSASATPAALTATPATGAPATAGAASAAGSADPTRTLKHYMETAVKSAMKAGDMPAVRAALRKVPDLAPLPSWNAGPTGWRAFVDAAIAPEGNVGKSCKGCHEAWQKAYAEKYRDRAIR